MFPNFFWAILAEIEQEWDTGFSSGWRIWMIKAAGCMLTSLKQIRKNMKFYGARKHRKCAKRWAIWSEAPRVWLMRKKLPKNDGDKKTSMERSAKLWGLGTSVITSNQRGNISWQFCRKPMNS